MSDGVLGAVLGVVAALLGFLLFSRRAQREDGVVGSKLEALERSFERVERGLREELSRVRTESIEQGRLDREELRDVLRNSSESMREALQEQVLAQRSHFELFGAQLQGLTSATDQGLRAQREGIELRLQRLQEDNGRHLEQIRVTVDEKLQGALEKRLGESFQLVSERLEQVHKGLGEMQTLAHGVGDLKRVFSNVKNRGGWGEVVLETLLSDLLSPEQYVRNARTKETGKESVEFAIRLPGLSSDAPVLLPVDSKFPIEDFQRLGLAQERGDLAEVETQGKALELRMRNCAKDIRDKYLNPPVTTDFGILFLPSEGLYAEVMRRQVMVDVLRREYQVVVTGPSTFAALLNSLQMGFRTLAIEKRSSEVWNLLGAVKTEFGKFGQVLESVKKKLDEASSSMDTAAQRTRAIERKLKRVEQLPDAQATALLGDGAAVDEKGAELDDVVG